MAEPSFIYCNQMQGTTSSWDILLTFERIVAVPAGAGKDPEPVVQEQVRVAMSPGHAKLMLAVLYENVEGYETHVGRIPLDKKAQERYDNFVKKMKAHT